MTCNASTETKVTALILLWKPPWCMHKHKDQNMFPSSWPCISACLAFCWPVSENQALIIHSSHHFFLSFHISSLPLDETWTFWSIYITGQCCKLQPFWLIWQVHFGGKFWHLNFDLETTHFSLLQGWVGGLKDFCTRWSHGSQVGQRGDQSSLTECKGGLYGKIFGF